MPDNFKFAVKASRYCTNRRDLQETGESIAKILGQGLMELDKKLGPILWQFMPTKKFDAEELEAFLKMLPEQIKGLHLRHALEVWHESFLCPEFVGLTRKYGAAAVCAHSEKYLRISDQTADFSYSRLMCSREDIETGYSDSELDVWARTAMDWSNEKLREGLEYITSPATLATGRDIYMFVISGAKIKAPAAAQALMKRIKN